MLQFSGRATVRRTKSDSSQAFLDLLPLVCRRCAALCCAAVLGAMWIRTHPLSLPLPTKAAFSIAVLFLVLPLFLPRETRNYVNRHHITDFVCRDFRLRWHGGGGTAA